MKKSNLLFILLTAMYSGSGQTDSLKNKDFLNITESQRHWWYSGAFTALGHLAFLENEAKGQCVWNWLFAEPEKKEALLIESFKKYPDHSPTSIIIALLYRDCQVFSER